MKFELKTQFRIESARFLPHLPEGHPCSRMHGHSFVVSLRLIGLQDPQIGWVRDYHEIDETLKPLKMQLDHRVLNEVPGLLNPTSENLAKWIFDQAKATIPELVQVTVSETPTTECSYPVL
ncbi:MAG: 6-pyruvoyl tetrahydropterin synthase family protein [Pseudobdellovibrionaceae bacterium]